MRLAATGEYAAGRWSEGVRGTKAEDVAERVMDRVTDKWEDRGGEGEEGGAAGAEMAGGEEERWRGGEG